LLEDNHGFTALGCARGKMLPVAPRPIAAKTGDENTRIIPLYPSKREFCSRFGGDIKGEALGSLS
jgi:hypothetical protein